MADPMSAQLLVRALVGEGVVMKAARAGWSTHERDGATGKPFGPVNGVMIHHTASHDSRDVIYDGYAELPGPLAHAYIDKQGVVWMCSAGRANHAGAGDRDVLNAVITESYVSRPPAPNERNTDGNDRFYGFECENLGNGKDPWPVEQYNAMVKAAAAVCRHYGWSEKSVIGHLEWTDQKIDPKGFDMIKFRADVKAARSMPPGVWPAQVKEPEMTLEEKVDKILQNQRVAPWWYKNPDFDGRDMHQVLRDIDAKLDQVLAKLGNQ